MHSIRDLITYMPAKREELSDYITRYYNDIGTMVANYPQYRTTLETAVNEAFDKYKNHFGGLTAKLSGVGHAIGYTADAWFLATGDFIGALGGKFLNLLAQIPQKSYALVYGLRTGDYRGAAQNILEGLVSYVPTLTFVDQGLGRIAQKAMVRDAVYRFEKATGTYKGWTTKLADTLKDKYRDVKDRSKNVFTPIYQPAFQPA